MNWPTALVLTVAILVGAFVACNALWAKATSDAVTEGMTLAMKTICYQEGWNAGTYRLSVAVPDPSTECRAFFTFGLEDGRAGVFDPPIN